MDYIMKNLSLHFFDVVDKLLKVVLYMRCDLKKKYEKYNVTKIYLSYEGIKYEFMREKFFDSFESYVNEKYYASMPRRDLFENFVCELNEKCGESRFSTKFESGKTFERNFEDIALKGKKPKSAAEEERCVNIIRDMEVILNKTTLLSNPDDIMKKKNEYIHALILPFIELMAKTDLYYYIPHTINAEGHNCYRNQLKMIEDNIQILFDGEECDETYKLWQEIIEPLRSIIGGDYPGIKSGLWLDANSNLAYFDCVYEIAEKDYQLYENIIENPKLSQIHFNVTIGNKETEVKENLKKRNAYFNKNNIKNYETEQQVFFAEFKKAYLDIVKRHMYIDCIEI